MTETQKAINAIEIWCNSADISLQKARTVLENLQNSLAKSPNEPPVTDWVKVQDGMPNDDERVVIRTKDGATYFLHPIEGKFPADVLEWYRLPK